MLQQCLSRMNRNDLNLSFTLSCDVDCITFLDVEIYKGEGGSLCSKLYRKPTAGNTILYASSFHPHALIDSIPYSQYLRIKRNCSDDSIYEKEAAKLSDRLLARGYSHAFLKRSCKQASMKPRKDLLHIQKPKNDYNALRIIIKYNKQQRKVRAIVEKYWHVLILHPSLGQFVPAKPLFTFRRATSIRDKIVNSEFKSESTKTHCKYKGTFMCGTCKYCRFMCIQKNPTLPNGKTFYPKHFAHCKTIGVIYMLQCSCGCFYVRKTKLECRYATLTFPWDAMSTQYMVANSQMSNC